jgi:hypothetical protein
MTTLRFDWQRQKVSEIIARDWQPKPILNVGCNEDPAGLKRMAPNVVVNCDLHEYDETMDRRNLVDKVFDATEPGWPFDDDSCSLVILGDIIEHLSGPEAVVALSEAHRVARALAITVPHDPRYKEEPDYDEKIRSMQRGAIHITEVTQDYLEGLLMSTRWAILEWQTVDYGFTPEGYFVLCERRKEG